MILEQGIVFMIIGMSAVLVFLCFLILCVLASGYIIALLDKTSSKNNITSHAMYNVISKAIRQHRSKKDI